VSNLGSLTRSGRRRVTRPHISDLILFRTLTSPSSPHYSSSSCWCFQY